MKSERRHELEQNKLADWTVHVIEKVKPYTNVIVGGTIAVLILAIGIGLWSRNAHVESESAWTMYYAALSTDSDKAVGAMQEVSVKYPDTEAAQWATVCEGDIRLCNACEELFIDKTHANMELKDAIECYKKTLEFKNPLLDERATFGLARAYESQGNLDEAEATYKEQLKKWKDGIYASVAENRLEDLGKKSTKEFYDLFKDYRPQPKKEPKPLDGPLDFDKSAIPSLNDMGLPALETGDVTEEPTIEEPKVEEPKKEEPKTEEPKIEEPKTEEPKKEPETTE
ncbi:MAG: hypothetical protein PVH19_14455 [Planctomycetia bacterium]|jgi:tetratricopeptide (TPR) repeat protein